MSESLFPDADLILYVHRTYGTNMGERCAEIFGLDPKNESGFAHSIRRSLSREVAQNAVKSHPGPENPPDPPNDLPVA